jgi:hypothetical protein
VARCYEAKGDYDRATDSYEACDPPSAAEAERAAVAANYEKQRTALREGGARAWCQTKLEQLRHTPRQIRTRWRVSAMSAAEKGAIWEILLIAFHSDRVIF